MHRILTSEFYKVASPADILDGWTQDELNDAHDAIDYLVKLQSKSAPRPPKRGKR